MPGRPCWCTGEMVSRKRPRVGGGLASRSFAVEPKLGAFGERRDAVEHGRAVMYTHAHMMMLTFLSRALSHIYIYITRGGVPCCHMPNIPTSRSLVTSLRPVPLLSRDPAGPIILLTPRSHKHHHSETMMPRHTIRNSRYETPDLRRPVSSHHVHQTGLARGR